MITPTTHENPKLPSNRPSGSAPLRWWIGERCSRARMTIIVQASSRQEAQDALDRRQGTETDVTYYDIQRAKVIREDKPNAPAQRPPAKDV